jgi:transcriptional regulator with PAS, ATPase and Fis domain
MQQLRKVVENAARQDGIVLLEGESGTGKDHLARCIHRWSQRAEGPFFAINCAALTRELAESELFGHEPGAFTGTRGRKRGLLELAEKGSLLLNEIGELDPAIQSKLLTFLDTKSFVRVGGEKSISIDARLFAATNRDLLREVQDRRFRQDLYYRLAVFPIRLPPLRQRRADIPLIVEELLDKLFDDLGLAQRPLVGPDAMRALEEYEWPGNIRELRNVLERAIMLGGGKRITERDLSLQDHRGQWSYTINFPQGRSLHDVTREVARRLVLEALRRTGGKKQDAARLLGISRHALAHQLKRLQIRA